MGLILVECHSFCSRTKLGHHFQRLGQLRPGCVASWQIRKDADLGGPRSSISSKMKTSMQWKRGLFRWTCHQLSKNVWRSERELLRLFEFLGKITRYFRGKCRCSACVGSQGQPAIGFVHIRLVKLFVQPWRACIQNLFRRQRHFGPTLGLAFSIAWL